MASITISDVRAVRSGDTLAVSERLGSGFAPVDLVEASASLLASSLSSPEPIRGALTVDRSTGELITTLHGSGISEGPSFGAFVTPGGVRLVARDLARAERAAERAADAVRMLGNLAAVEVATPLVWAAPATVGQALGDDKPRHRSVSEWSGKSRRRMTFALASIDYAPLFASGLPAMWTLTYPGDWLRFAPDGRTVKRHLAALRRRYNRAYGQALPALWKLEFQRRGAPHFHLLAPIPFGVSLSDFRAWLSESWNLIVMRGLDVSADERMAHVMAGTSVDVREGFRMRDVKRIAVYFTKHSLKSSGDKEYQHIVPEEWREPGTGPGRFWGVWSLEVVRYGMTLDVRSFVRLRRLLRRYSRANGRTRVLRGGSLHGGWVLVNDASAFASQLSRALALAP